MYYVDKYFFFLQTFLNPAYEHEDYRDVDLSRIDKSLLDSLMPFQREGVWYVLASDFNVC